ncbi:aminotransferase class I/II-fold pyridoxal phosphate-dependent enzyme [Portibacter marinus]|uniref:aminotransferase class I/II-fold pyridoxal phosphate-dependent enzyme n=1 Tax=Portibacter marinus TaxID=2898660 RepID=UPI001F45165C|nr:pyridoxal phosphate-dependent aminotransferase family protein [Portibacter marinus]
MIKAIQSDLFTRMREDMGPLGKYSEVAEGYFIFPRLEGPLSNRMIFKGKEVINWSINDYLGLGRNPEIIAVDQESIAENGMAYPMGSRMMSGDTALHEQLEIELSQFIGKESTLLLNFGYQGIMSAIDALLTRRDVVIYDANCHACIVDGVRLHTGKRFAYKHNDIESLEKYLKFAEKIVDDTGGGILVITEGVFGMQGDQGKLKEVIDLRSRFSFRLLVDDAHGFGTLGETGVGAGEAQGVQDEIDLYFSTFAKSMGSIGAFISGEKDIVKYLKYNVRSQIFAKSLPHVVVRGALKRLELIRKDRTLIDKLWYNVRNLQDGLRSAGFNLGNTNSCVTPVMLSGSVNEAMNLVKHLRESFGIFCSIVVYPVIPKGMILLRLIPTANHTDKDIEETINAFSSVNSKLTSGGYA